MTQTTTPKPGAATEFSNRRGVGPIVAAVGGLDPDSVLKATRKIAQREDAPVLAVSVLRPLPASMVGSEPLLVPPNYEAERFADLNAELNRRLAHVGAAAASWSKEVIVGEPSAALADVARRLHASMLVIGLGRHRPLDRIFGAETTLRAIRRAACPVLVVHPDFDCPFHDPVVATDFSASSAHATRVVIPLLGAVATLHIVHVWEPSGSASPAAAAADEAYAASLPQRFQRFISAIEVPEGVTVKKVIREGKAAERILDYAATHHADLIVAGRHGHNLRERFLVGSQTTAMVRGADRSVLVTPEPPFAESDRLSLLLSGSTRSTDSREWEAELHGLSQRNHGRATIVEIEDLTYGAQVIESGYLLLGAAYDPAKKRVELTLGDAAHGARHVMRAIGGVDSITIETDATGRDVGVRITHGGGQTALTFLGE